MWRLGCDPVRLTLTGYYSQDVPKDYITVITTMQEKMYEYER